MENTIIYPLQSAKGKLRASIFWKMFVCSVGPIFDLFVEYILNFSRKLAYWRFRSENPVSENAEFQKTSIIVEENNPEFVKFAHWLRNEISDELLAKHRKKILSDASEETFMSNLFLDLSEDVRFKVAEFALSKAAFVPAINYFRVIPYIDSISLLFNIPKSNSGQIGSKEWHRDDARYKAFNIFMCISEVDDNSGAYYGIGEDDIPRRAIIPLEEIDLSKSIWKRYRHSTELLRKYAPKLKLKRLAGKIGTAALVDPSVCYHRGGHCISGERIMLQVTYTIDAPEPVPSLAKMLKLEKHPQVSKFEGSYVSSLLSSGNEQTLWVRIGKRNPTFAIGRRILSYFTKASA